MYKLLIISILFLFSFDLFSQNEDIDKRLIKIEQNEKQYLRLGNYSIMVENHALSFSDENIKKVKKKTPFPKKTAASNVNTFIEYKHKVFRHSEVLKGNLVQNTSFYYLEKNPNILLCVYFQSIDYQDTTIEKKFIESILRQQDYTQKITSVKIDSIDFAGRNIPLMGNCNWINVADIQCPYLGEMNFAYHENMENAKKSNTNQLLFTKTQSMNSVIEEKEIDVIFEGKETKAKRIVLKIKLPKMLIGGSNKLVVYYVAEEIRGYNISCVMSHYDNDVASEKELPALLEKFLKIK